MKFVIENFSTTNDTQSVYFANTLNEMGHKAITFDLSKNSIYDMIDIHQPDIYIANGSMISRDLLSYLENNDNNIDILFSVKDLNNNQIKALDQFCLDNNIQSSFFFTNVDKSNMPKIKHNIVSIKEAADLNLLNRKANLEYYIDKAIFVYNKNSISDCDGSYHNISTNPKIKDDVDIYLPEISLAPLYRFYNTIIFKDNIGYLPQPFFDAIIMGAKVYFDIKDENARLAFDSMVKKAFSEDVILDYNNSNKCEDFTNIIKHILEKHTNKKRAISLLSNIKKKETVES